MNKVRPPKKPLLLLAFGMLTVFVFLAFQVLFYDDIASFLEEPEQLRRWFQQFGVWDKVIFVLVRILQTVVKFIPSEPLELGAGYIWGAVPGMVYCLVGNMLGSVIIWGITRRLGRGFAEKVLPNKLLDMLSALQDSGNIYIVLFVLFSIPGSPKDSLTYVAGLLPIRFVPFMSISLLSRIPAILSSTLCGAYFQQKNYLVSGILFGGNILLGLAGGFGYRAYVRWKKANHASA